jgi:hypothetical protein
MASGLISLSLMFVALALQAELYEVRDGHAVHEFVDAVCSNTTVMNITSPDDLWSDCQAGDYEGEATLASFESVESLCSIACRALSMTVMPGQASIASLIIIVGSSFSAVLGIMLICSIKSDGRAFFEKISTNRFSQFSHSLHDDLMRPGQSDLNDDAIANSVQGGAVDVEAGEGEVANPMVEPEQAYQPPQLH